MAELSVSVAPAPTEALRTLLVEDDETAAGLLARALRRHGFDVQTTASLQAALRLTEHWQPQAAVVDLRLQQESGLSLIPVLVQQQPGIRILMLTGYASIATAVQAIKLGASDYLAKPAPILEIVAALRGRRTGSGSVQRISRPSIRRFEWEYIHQVLAEHDGNISETARALGMQRRTLQRKLAKRPTRS
jgi:two-component system response regulator RegA